MGKQFQGYVILGCSNLAYFNNKKVISATLAIFSNVARISGKIESLFAYSLKGNLNIQ